MSGRRGAHNGPGGTGGIDMPARLKWPLFTAIALAVIGALYLIAVRGEALLLDLSRLAAYCF